MSGYPAMCCCHLQAEGLLRLGARAGIRCKDCGSACSSICFEIVQENKDALARTEWHW